MSPKKMNKILTAVIVLLILVTAAGLFFANQKLTGMAKETTTDATQIEVSKKQIGIYELTKFKVDSLSSTSEVLGQILPKSEEQSAIIAELSGFARRARPVLIISSIEFKEQSAAKPGDAKKSKLPAGVNVIPIEVSAKNVNYSSVVDFLKELETNRRTMQVYNIGLVQNEDDKNLINVTISMNLYSRSDQAKPAGNGSAR